MCDDAKTQFNLAICAFMLQLMIDRRDIASRDVHLVQRATLAALPVDLQLHMIVHHLVPFQSGLVRSHSLI